MREVITGKGGVCVAREGGWSSAQKGHKTTNVEAPGAGALVMMVFSGSSNGLSGRIARGRVLSGEARPVIEPDPALKSERLRQLGL